MSEEFNYQIGYEDGQRCGFQEGLIFGSTGVKPKGPEAYADASYAKRGYPGGKFFLIYKKGFIDGYNNSYRFGLNEGLKTD